MNIKADRDYIINILDKVKNGSLSVPEFQRDFVWNTKQVIDLFDSIMKGYPIGSLILWKPETAQFKELDNVGGIKIDKLNDVTDKQYILDGRQRLTALLSSLCVGGEYYNHICIDLNEMQILNIPSNRGKKINILSLGAAFDTYELVEYIDTLRQSKLSEEKKHLYADRAKNINRILLSYELGYISVIGGHIDDAVEVFSRLNSKTTKISSDYMLQALAYSPQSSFLFANEITKIKEKLSKYNFNRIDRDLILKCVYNYLDVPFIDGKEQMILKIKETLPDIMLNVAIDIEMAVKFLYHRCGLIDCKMLPYTYQFVMIALFFKNNRNPMPNQITELVKWFFYTTYSGYFTNTSLTVVREDIKNFQSYSLGQSSSPIEYTKNDFDLSLPSTVRLSGVRTCAMAAVAILYEEGNKDPNACLNVFVLPNTGEKTWGNTFFVSSKNAPDEIICYLNSDASWNPKYEIYALSETLVSLYRSGKIEDFVVQRQALMLQREEKALNTLLKNKLVVNTSWKDLCDYNYMSSEELIKKLLDIEEDLTAGLILSPRGLTTILCVVSTIESQSNYIMPDSMWKGWKNSVRECINSKTVKDDLYMVYLDFCHTLSLFGKEGKSEQRLNIGCEYFMEIYHARWDAVKNKMIIALENLTDETADGLIQLMQDTLPDHSGTYAWNPIFQEIDVDKFCYSIERLGNGGKTALRNFFIERYKLRYYMQDPNDSSYKFEEEIMNLQHIYIKIKEKAEKSVFLEQRAYNLLADVISMAIKRCNGNTSLLLK